MRNGLLAKVFSKCKCLVFDESKIEEIVYLVILDKQWHPGVINKSPNIPGTLQETKIYG